MEDGTLYAIPHSSEWASEESARELVEYFLDWERVPSKMRVEMLQDGYAFVRCWGGQKEGEVLA